MSLRACLRASAMHGGAKSMDSRLLFRLFSFLAGIYGVSTFQNIATRPSNRGFATIKQQTLRCSVVPPQGPVSLSKQFPRTSFEIQLSRPMGMILEEAQNPQRIFVAELSESGSAAASMGKVLVGDAVEKVGEQDCSGGSTLEQAMDLIASWPAGEPVRLTLSRDSSIASVVFDGKRAVAARLGENLGQVAQRAKARVPYSCDNGVCGTCEYSTLSGNTHVRLCTRPLTESLLVDKEPPGLVLKKSTRPCKPTGPVRYI